MTKKDYELIARAVWNNYDSIARSVTRGTSHTDAAQSQSTLRLLTHTLATALQSENPRFDYDRFYDACTTGKGI